MSIFENKAGSIRENTINCVKKIYYFKKSTIETASLHIDSPKTKINNKELTWICSKTQITATGSTADIIVANNNISIIDGCPLNQLLKNIKVPPEFLKI